MMKTSTGPILESNFSPSRSRTVKTEGLTTFSVTGGAVLTDGADHSSWKSKRPVIPVLSMTGRPMLELRYVLQKSSIVIPCVSILYGPPLPKPKRGHGFPRDG